MLSKFTNKNICKYKISELTEYTYIERTIKLN